MIERIAAGESSPSTKVLTGRTPGADAPGLPGPGARSARRGLWVFHADQPAKGDDVNMSRFTQRLLDRKNRPVKRSNQRARVQLEPLEERRTPCVGCNNLKLTAPRPRATSRCMSRLGRSQRTTMASPPSASMRRPAWRQARKTWPRAGLEQGRSSSPTAGVAR